MPGALLLDQHLQPSAKYLWMLMKLEGSTAKRALHSVGAGGWLATRQRHKHSPICFVLHHPGGRAGGSGGGSGPAAAGSGVPPG